MWMIVFLHSSRYLLKNFGNLFLFRNKKYLLQLIQLEGAIHIEDWKGYSKTGIFITSVMYSYSVRHTHHGIKATQSASSIMDLAELRLKEQELKRIVLEQATM